MDRNVLSVGLKMALKEMQKQQYCNRNTEVDRICTGN